MTFLTGRILLAGALVAAAATALTEHDRIPGSRSIPSVARLAAGMDNPGSPAETVLDTRPGGVTSVRRVWPASGQAAFTESGRAQIQTGPSQHPAPIASLAKVMVAFLVLRDHPLGTAGDGPAVTFTAADVADTARRRAAGQSVVAVAAGERLSERQALLALLLPSANNVAEVLARWDAGSVAAFVDRMNATAQTLGMDATRYTDPSGYASKTVSTAADQLRITLKAMALPVFADLVRTRVATLPVAGRISNTDALLGQQGFIGVKTGSDDAAGGCFAFRAVRPVNGRATTITGVVLGQPGQDHLAAGLTAAATLVDRITGSTPGPPLPPSGGGPTPPRGQIPLAPAT